MAATLPAETFTWAQTFHGRPIDLERPTPDQIHWDDVAAGLAYNNRFAGSAGTYSVAQHSIIVESVLPVRWKLFGLLHDAEEFIEGDLTAPMARALEARGADISGFRAIKEDLRHAIFLKAELSWPMPEKVRAIIKAADLAVMAAEKRDLMRPAPRPWGYEHITPIPQTITRWPAEYAHMKFEERLKHHGLTEGDL